MDYNVIAGNILKNVGGAQNVQMSLIASQD